MLKYVGNHSYIHCITVIGTYEPVFFQHLQKNMDLDSPNFLTSLVGIGHMAQLCPGEFATPVKGIVSKFIVKDLLMQDRVSFYCRKY